MGVCGCFPYTDSSLEIGLEPIQVRFFLLHHFCPLFPDRVRQVGVTVHQLGKLNQAHVCSFHHQFCNLMAVCTTQTVQANAGTAANFCERAQFFWILVECFHLLPDFLLLGFVVVQLGAKFFSEVSILGVFQNTKDGIFSDRSIFIQSV